MTRTFRAVLRSPPRLRPCSVYLFPLLFCCESNDPLTGTASFVKTNLNMSNSLSLNLTLALLLSGTGED